MRFTNAIRDALKYGTSPVGYSANHFESIGGPAGHIVFHYRQSMLANIWHVESGQVWTVPILFEKNAGEYERAARWFKEAAEQLKWELSAC